MFDSDQITAHLQRFYRSFIENCAVLSEVGLTLSICLRSVNTSIPSVKNFLSQDTRWVSEMPITHHRRILKELLPRTNYEFLYLNGI